MLSRKNTSLFFLFILTGILFSCIPFQQKLNKDHLNIGLTLIPPSPVSNKITLDIRAGLKNYSNTQIKNADVTFYLDKKSTKNILNQEQVSIAPDSAVLVKFSWETAGNEGKHRIILEVITDNQHFESEKEIIILHSETRSTDRIDGAWFGFYHWSEDEGKYWNSEIKKMTDTQWDEMMSAQSKIGMNIIVIQEIFRNPTAYAHKHTMEQDGYKGIPYYPSTLYPGKVDLASEDPLEAILAAADKNNMHVFVGIGLYAWFDFSAESLRWHKKVADEVWQKYGHHPSFYGWYISEVQDGGLGTTEDRENIVSFFREFKQHVYKYGPDKPIMLATNSHNLRGAEPTYRELLKHLDILCPFAFHRMPEHDLTGEQAAEKLQLLADEAEAHLWLDMEVFEFAEKNALVPRPIDGVLSDLHRFKNFEKILCYQFPGLMNSPEMSIKPGGERTVKLYLDYKKYYDSLQKE